MQRMKGNSLRIDVCEHGVELHFMNSYNYEQTYFHHLMATDNDRIEFVKSKIRKRLEKVGGMNLLYCIRDNNNIHGLFGIDYNPLHSRILDLNVIEIGPFYFLDYSRYHEVLHLMRSFFSSLQISEGVLIKCKLDNSDFNSIRLFQECGFRYVTSSLKMVYNPSRKKHVFESYVQNKFNKVPDEYTFRNLHYSEDRDSLFTLISQHKKSVHHYMYEHVACATQLDSLFKQWFEMYAQKQNTTVLGLFRKTDDALLGFTSFCGPFSIGGIPVYSRDLTIIDQAYRGKNLVVLLYKQMNELTNACIEGNPLSDNYRNIQLNQNCGYVIAQSKCYLIKES